MTTPTLANPALTNNFLFEQFAILATAPDGIARMRELILQLAVQGKLGTQDAGDEPANKLSSKILEEKKRLIKKGEISKSRALPKIESEEIPFHIPKNWVWLRLDDIGHSCGQKEPDKIFTYIDVTAINKERGLVGDEVNVLQPHEAPSRARKLVKKGTVIYSTVRPYLLNIAIVDTDFNPEPIVSTAFAVLHPFEGIFNRYLFYYLRSKPFVDYVESQMTGMAYPAINDQKFHMGLIPVPPTAEQHRIVAKVDRLMALCDELEARQQQERAGCLRLGTASLAGLQNATHPEEFGRLWEQVCDAFDLILDCPENVAVLRQMILQLAMQGRLVRQEPEDERAEELFEKIKKIKKKALNERTIQNDKLFSPIIKETPPWTIPTEWSWVRLQDIFEITRGGSPRPSGDPQFFGGNIPWITVGELTKDIGKFLNEVSDSLTEAGSERSRFVNKDDLLLTNSGATLGVPKISKIRGCINDGVAKLFDFHNLIDHEYAYFFLFQQTIAFRNVNQGMGQPNLNTPIIAGWFFPLPPLAEQHRIVAKVDTLMALCDALESRLKERAGMQERLAGAVVKQVAGS